jgi:hypothetical protein
VDLREGEKISVCEGLLISAAEVVVIATACRWLHGNKEEEEEDDRETHDD